MATRSPRHAGTVFDPFDITVCPTCPDHDSHVRRLWWPCEEPDRPLDLHGLFSTGDCPACAEVWERLGLPRADLPDLVVG